MTTAPNVPASRSAISIACSRSFPGPTSSLWKLLASIPWGLSAVACCLDVMLQAPLGNAFRHT